MSQTNLLHEMGGLVLNAVIIAGYAFASSLVGFAWAGEGINIKAALYTAGITAMLRSFAYLMRERNLNGV